MDYDQKKLKLILGFVSFLVVALTIALIAVATSRKSQEKILEVDADVCTSQTCKDVANYLYANLDESVDPCEDFYNFSCGGWRARNPRPPGEDAMSVPTILQQKSKLKLMSILEDETLFQDKSLVIHQALKYYRSCKKGVLDTSDDNENMKSMLINLGFPAIDDNWNENSYNWLSAAIIADSQYGTETFFNISVESDDNNVPRITLRAPDFQYGRQLAAKDKTTDEKDNLKANYQTITVKKISVLKNAGGLISTTMNFLDLETELAKIATDDPKDQQEITIAEMSNTFPDIEWLSLFQGIFKSLNITIDNNIKINVSDAQYYQKLGALRKGTPLKDLANYIALRVIAEFGSEVMYSFKLVDVPILALVPDVSKMLCSAMTEKFFALPLSYYYVRQFFKNDTLIELKDFVTEVKASMTNTLQSNEWMDDQTKLLAQLKLNRMISYIALPSWLTSAEDINSLYSTMGPMDIDINVKSSSKITAWLRQLMLRPLKEKTPDMFDFLIFTPSEVNAFYAFMVNKIIIKIGIMHKPYYYHNAPLAVNFGSIGFVLGHEILHGFDTTGANYDYRGKPKIWWKNETREVYDKKVQCFVDQYNNYPEPLPGTTRKIDGEKTIGENIADNGGVYQAFNAYKMYAALNAPQNDLRLPLEMSKYTTDQLFFIGAANTYCENDSPKQRSLLLDIDNHSPAQARVMVPLSNSQYFSKAFNCPVGSRMNPVKKCVLW